MPGAPEGLDRGTRAPMRGPVALGVLAAVALLALNPWGVRHSGQGGSRRERPASPADARHAAPPAALGTAPVLRPHDPLTVRPQRQRYPNNCEATALSMLLEAAGAPHSQQEIMRLLPRDGPPDPVIRSDGSWIWGDPERGFVGRIQGGGVAGGYGVYVGPVLRLARRFVTAHDLTDRPWSAVAGRLRRHRAVMAWIGLSDGPYQPWTTPKGRKVLGDFGEHSVLLVGMRAGAILYDDPLTGRRAAVSPAAFMTMWRRLGRRAITA